VGGRSRNTPTYGASYSHVVRYPYAALHWGDAGGGPVFAFRRASNQLGNSRVPNIANSSSCRADPDPKQTIGAAACAKWEKLRQLELPGKVQSVPRYATGASRSSLWNLRHAGSEDSLWNVLEVRETAASRDRFAAGPRVSARRFGQTVHRSSWSSSRRGRSSIRSSMSPSWGALREWGGDRGPYG
jgi:hypothetical protein